MRFHARKTVSTGNTRGKRIAAIGNRAIEPLLGSDVSADEMADAMIAYSQTSAILAKTLGMTTDRYLRICARVWDSILVVDEDEVNQ